MSKYLNTDHFHVKCITCGDIIQFKIGFAITLTGETIPECPTCGDRKPHRTKAFENFVKYYCRLVLFDEENKLHLQLTGLTHHIDDMETQKRIWAKAHFVCTECLKNVQFDYNRIDDIAIRPGLFRCPNRRCKQNFPSNKSVKEYFTALKHVLYSPVIHKQWLYQPFEPLHFGT